MIPTIREQAIRDFAVPFVAEAMVCYGLLLAFAVTLWSFV